MMDSMPRMDTKSFEAGSKNLSKLRGKLSEQMKAIMLEKGWLFVIVGFLLGRAIILSVVSPFAVAFLATIWFVHRDKSAKVMLDRKSTRLNSSHVAISYAVFCLKKKTINLLGAVKL